MVTKDGEHPRYKGTKLDCLRRNGLKRQDHSNMGCAIRAMSKDSGRLPVPNLLENISDFEIGR